MSNRLLEPTPAVAQPGPLRQHRRSPGRAGRLVERAVSTPRRRILVEGVIVALTLIVLEIVVFNGYFRGETAPPWDFVNHYNTEAYAWWHDGSFFRPADWLPYLWGGYPSTLNLQNSSFYLPVGLTSLLTTFTLHASAVLSAMHVALGALGAYVFGRTFRMRPSAAMVGLVVWFFAAGFYANASHLDIMRSYAWVPWVLACASPRWPWRRWWGVLLATFVFWNAILAMYPGVLIASVYIGAVWVLVLQLTYRPRFVNYLLPLACSVVLAALATLLRFLPFYLTRGISSPGGPDDSILSWRLLSTFFYRYDGQELPNDTTMRSFFLPIVVFAAVAFVKLSQPVVKAAIAAGLTALALGTPGTPWADAAPGLDFSRFTMSDFKVYLLFALCALTMSAVNSIIVDRVPVGHLDGRVTTKAERPSTARAALLVALLAGTIALGVINPHPATEWISAWLILPVAIGVLLLAHTSLARTQLWSVMALVCGLAALSGVAWATTYTPTWSANRLNTENFYYEAPVNTLVMSREDTGELAQRPARLPNRESNPAYLRDAFGNRSFYDGTLRLSGYTNLRGTPTYEKIMVTLSAPGTEPAARAFWMAPGMAIASQDGALPSVEDSTACSEDGRCGLEHSESIAYDPSGTFVYRLDAGATTEVSLNEAFYAGWTATSCSASGECTDHEVFSGSAGQVVVSDIPSGSSTLTLSYALPGKAASWAAFWVALTLVVLWAGVLAVHDRRRRGEYRTAPRWHDSGPLSGSSNHESDSR